MITTVDPRSATHFPLTRIVHLDDHLATRAGLRTLVVGEPDLLWVGAAADEAGMWTLIRRTHPSLVMLDVHHPGRGGLELCAELKAMVPTPAVVIYTSEEHEHLRIAARLVGADGVITKDANRRTLLEAIRLAGRGRSGPVKIARAPSASGVPARSHRSGDLRDAAGGHGARRDRLDDRAVGRRRRRTDRLHGDAPVVLCRRATRGPQRPRGAGRIRSAQ
jgi:DNA-binding NarL/FixJ family response regulator